MDRKKKFKFDVVIGNPPYQEDNRNNNRQSPIYNYFMDESYKISDVVELVTPARFLFNAGQTPKQWNNKMLTDKHLKVLMYEPDCSKIFPNTEIKGGVAITLRDVNKDFGEIGIFTEYDELNAIIHKVMEHNDESMSDIITGAVPYHYTDELRKEHPEYVYLAGDSFDVRTNALDKLADKIYFLNKPDEKEEYIQIFGLYKKQRNYMWIKKKYITYPDNFNKYKVMISKANGSGKFGEALSTPVIGDKKVGHTQSFISLGALDSKVEAENLEKYIKGKFSRCLLSILKTTQDITPYRWKYVPVQNFSDNSDIDWNKSIKEIDAQLYKKYGLLQEEINFIEANVKEME